MLNPPMFRSALVRRVSIYLVLSSAAVGAVNLLELDQQNLYQIYIPLFIGIYVLSRWIDSKVGASQPSRDHETTESVHQRGTDKGFGS